MAVLGSTEGGEKAVSSLSSVALGQQARQQGRAPRRSPKLRRAILLVVIAPIASAAVGGAFYGLVELGHPGLASALAGFTFLVSVLVISGMAAVATRLRAQTDSALELFRVLRRHLPRATFFARSESGRYLWFIGKEGSDAIRTQKQIEDTRSEESLWAEAPPVLAVDADGLPVAAEDTARLVSAKITGGIRPFQIDMASMDFGLGESVEVGVHQDGGTQLENSPVVRGLLPMVSNRFRLMIYSADLQTVSVYWTQERWRLGLGIPLDSSLIYGCVHPDDAETVRSVIEDCVEYRKNGSCIYRWTGPDARESLQLAASFAPIFDDQGNFEGLLSIALDVSSEIRGTVADVNSFVVLEQLRRWFEHVPSYFYPVTSRLDALTRRMDGLATVALQRQTHPEKEVSLDKVLETCTTLGTAARSMRAEVHNLSGSIQYMANFLQDLEATHELTPTPLLDACQSVIDTLHSELAERGVTVQLQMQAERTERSMGLIHPETFQQSLGSMLQNSVRFSPVHGTIDVVIRDDERDSKNFLVVEIADEGPAPDGGNYADLGRSHLIGSPIRSTKRDTSMMVVAAMSLSLQGISVQYEARPGGAVDENGQPMGLIGRLRVPRGG